jgi:hypothetical protein
MLKQAIVKVCEKCKSEALNEIHSQPQRITKRIATHSGIESWQED